MKISNLLNLLRKKAGKTKTFVFLLSLTAISFAFLNLPLNSNAANPVTKVEFVSPAWVADRANDPNLRVLDVRVNPLDYVTAHIPNAVLIADGTFRGPNGILPVQYWKNDKLQSLFVEAGITDKSQVVVYSDDKDVLGATSVAYLLERGGLPKVAVLNGGFTGYKEAKLPVTKEFPKYQPSSFTVRDNPSVRATLPQVKAAIEKPGVVFIDPRPPELFAGEKDVWIRNGHIPGAKNIPWPSFTIGEANFHQLKSLDDIKQLLAKRGITPDQDIIITCSTGREATLQYHVLKHLLGYPKVRVYEGSWTEYSSIPDLPVEKGRDPALS